MTGSFQLSLIAVNDLLDGSQLLAIGIFVETAEQRQSIAHGESGGLEVWLRKAPAGATEESGLAKPSVAAPQLAPLFSSVPRLCDQRATSPAAKRTSQVGTLTRFGGPTF